MAEKLDGVMLVVFTYLDQRLTANAAMPSEAILETPSASADANGSQRAEEEGDARADDSERLKRRTSAGGQGMEPVARLLQVGQCTVQPWNIGKG